MENILYKLLHIFALPHCINYLFLIHNKNVIRILQADTVVQISFHKTPNLHMWRNVLLHKMLTHTYTHIALHVMETML
jgi:hypothetical protein